MGKKVWGTGRRTQPERQKRRCKRKIKELQEPLKGRTRKKQKKTGKTAQPKD